MQEKSTFTMDSGNGSNFDRKESERGPADAGGTLSVTLPDSAQSAGTSYFSRPEMAPYLPPGYTELMQRVIEESPIGGARNLEENS